MDVSIVIPTMNRPRLLLRLVQYLDALSFQGKILIGDSSDETTFMESARALEAFRGRLDISHAGLKGHSVAAAVKALNERVSTKYVCLVADDDFLVPTTIAKCIEFLEVHPDYVAAHGGGVLIASTGDADVIHWVEGYRQTIAIEDTARSRLNRHLEQYSVSLFSVHRVGAWCRMFKDIPSPAELPQCCDKSFVDELLPCCLSVVYGKVGQVDGLYLIRQAHGGRYLLPTWFSWLSSATWQPSYVYFRDHLAQAMSLQDNISVSDAEYAVDLSFSAYIRHCVAADEGKTPAIRGVARRFVAFRTIWRLLMKLRDRIQPDGRLTLGSLLNPSSSYFRDFVPVFQAVTEAKVPILEAE